jgi:hypothetical protein
MLLLPALVAVLLVAELLEPPLDVACAPLLWP